MSRPMWFVDIVKHFFTDRFAISETTKKSHLIRKIVDFLLFEDDEIYYLPKEKVVLERANSHSRLMMGQNTLEIPVALEMSATNQQSLTMGSQVELTEPFTHEMILVEEDLPAQDDLVLPAEVVRHFIEQSNYCFLMNKCICRDSMQCKDYPIDLGCIFLGEAVLGINPRLGRLATKEEALERLQQAADLGLVHMIGRNKIDTQWMGVGPGFKLLSICNCCPCCCLYRTLPHLDHSISRKIAKMPGVEIFTNREQCIGCGACVEENVCFVGALSMGEDGYPVRNDLCVGCGRCVEVCPTHAIQITIEDIYVSETIARLSQIVDVS